LKHGLIVKQGAREFVSYGKRKPKFHAKMRQAVVRLQAASGPDIF